jgi:RNA polymerase sigma-70 factor, ECF subfamily
MRGETTGDQRPGPRDEAVESDPQIHVEVFCQCKELSSSIAYRMLGSAADAEDMLQETFIRWHRTAAAEIQSPRSFLFTVLSRLCIQHLESARAKREEYVGTWLPEPVFTGGPTDPSASPCMQMQESLSVAFLPLVEKLTPAEHPKVWFPRTRSVAGVLFGDDGGRGRGAG